MARALQAPEGDGAFTIDERAVDAQIAQCPLIEKSQQLPITVTPAPSGDRRPAAQQEPAKQGAKENDAAPRALHREDSVSQRITHELSGRSWRQRRARAITKR
jgi:hypothetical protein